VLTITETAAEAINTLISASQLPEGAGLRIAAQPDSEPTALELSVAVAPDDQDTVLEDGGATIFLEPIAAQALDDKVLDAQRFGEGTEEQYRFAIALQA
jgi:Fe-S cluster assembly iron-binding protein IscA